MSEAVEHPSSIIWPLPYRITFPYEQAVKCAQCGTTSTRIIDKRVQAKNLWFCCEEHRLLRRKAVLAGEQAALSKLPSTRSYDDLYDSDWGDLGLGPRKPIESIPTPTILDHIYGTMATTGDLKE